MHISCSRPRPLRLARWHCGSMRAQGALFSGVRHITAVHTLPCHCCTISQAEAAAAGADALLRSQLEEMRRENEGLRQRWVQVREAYYVGEDTHVHSSYGLLLLCGF
jgi:hypothetical protein